jgi:penicillin amidase
MHASPHRRPPSVALACALVLAACGSDDPTPIRPDTTTDAVEDLDAPTEDATDSGNLDDGATDGTPDPDAGADAGDTADADVLPPLPAPDDDEGGRAVIEGRSPDTLVALPGLSAPVHVFRTDGNVPHIFAHNRRDLALAMGYVVATDRYFVMDLGRRLGLGKLSLLLGDAALENDIESRGIGQRHVAERVIEALTPEQREIFDAFADGINAYIARAVAREVPPPSELRLAGTLLGTSDLAELMQPFDALDIAGFTAVVVYNLGFETTDARAAVAYERAATSMAGWAFGALRTEGALRDVWGDLRPVIPVASAPAWGTTRGGTSTKSLVAPPFRPGLDRDLRTLTRGLPADLAERTGARLERLQRRLKRDRDTGFGSNAWAVMASASATGNAMLASDGHLPLSVPSLFYQIGLNVRTLSGDADGLHQSGLIFPGFPYLAVGTNGHVAWSQTQLSGDITDWYREVVRLNDDGEPDATWFEGEWRPLTKIVETYDVANVPLLGSTGRTETWARWVTFDGRWIADIEGETATATTTPEPGSSVVTMQGSFVVPGDTDNDGTITALSFAYAGFQIGSLVSPVDGFGQSRTIDEFRDHTRSLVAYSQNIVVADRSGDVFYTGYQATPCRTYLPRDADGLWEDGADPNLLIDGTRFGNFVIPTLATGRVDESQAADPYRCVVPFDDYPQSINPTEGFVQTANNDPGPITFENDVAGQPWYIGGPWDPGFRGSTIVRELEAAIERGDADLDRMAAIQGNTDSRLGELLVPVFLDDLARAAALSPTSDEPWEARAAAVYAANADRFAAAAERLEAWADRGFGTDSGVVTFYQPEVSEAARANATATMIFNTWLRRWIELTLNDERLGGLWRYGGARGQTVLLWHMLQGRGPGNPMGLASWSDETEESVFFDIRNTPEVEHSVEILVLALEAALDWLQSPTEEPGVGGFGTDDMDAWLWGLRHQVRFESLLADFIGTDPRFGPFIRPFNISTTQLPLAPSIPVGDARRGLRWFPRPGDQFAVDAANPGLTGTNHTHGSGPVMRMLIELSADGTVGGRNILPGGQSALTDSDFFADQAALWLANETIPLYFHVADILTASTHHLRLDPAAESP